MLFLTETLGITDYLYEYKSEPVEELAAEDMKRDPVKELPLDIIYQIFSSFTPPELTNCCFVSKDWHLIGSDPLLWNKIHHARAFGKVLVEKIIGSKVGKEPRLPQNLHKILCTPCPFNKEKRVGQTHRLVLMPVYSLKNRIEFSKCKSFCWVLMTKEFVEQEDPDPKPMELSYDWELMKKQLFLLKCSRNASIEYRFPNRIEAYVWKIINDLKPKNIFWKNLLKNLISKTAKEVWEDLFPPTPYSFLCEERFEQNKEIFLLHFFSETIDLCDDTYEKIVAVHELEVLD